MTGDAGVRVDTVHHTPSSEPEEKKPPAPGLAVVEAFPADETPTPTRILRMADMDLFGELKVLLARRLLLPQPSSAQHSPD